MQWQLKDLYSLFFNNYIEEDNPTGVILNQDVRNHIESTILVFRKPLVKIKNKTRMTSEKGKNSRGMESIIIYLLNCSTFNKLVIGNIFAANMF